MYHFLYKVTNIINGKIYIGAHSTKDINDGYIGSGGRIYQNAIKKYGKESFIKEILKFFDTIEELYEYEKQIVNEDFIKDNSNYNQNLGGLGGWYHVNSNRDLFENPMYNEESRKKMAESFKKTRNGKNKEIYDEISRKNFKIASEKTKGSSWYYDPVSLETKRVYLGEHPPDGWVKGNKNDNGMKGKVGNNKDKKLSEETKEKIKDSWDEERRENHRKRMKESMRGNSINKGKRNYYDPVSLKEGLFFEGDQPENWVLGSPSRSKKRNRKNNG